jgi:DNA-binding transcriptional LysR family regulator
MSEAGAPTLDQLSVFAAVADTGSFSAAARDLKRAQSVISYTIANLEGQLGLSLFEREGRRPALTEAGRALLADARRVMMSLRARATSLTQGLEAEVCLVMDVMFPTDYLVLSLEAFAARFPTITVRLDVEAMGAVAQTVMDGGNGIGISGWLPTFPDALEHTLVGSVMLIPVAGPTHPLARRKGPVRIAHVRDHIQLVLSDRSRLTEGKDYGVLGVRQWRLADLGAKHALLRAGLGWGNMPEPMVRDDLARGRLVRLALAEGDWRYPFHLIHRADTSPGPAARWLAEALAARLKAEEASPVQLDTPLARSLAS